MLDMNSKNFDACCRTCLRDISEEIMYDIFQERTDLVNIAEILYTYTAVQLDKQDRLPKKLCHTCYNLLLSFHEFKTTACKADAKLREHFTEMCNYRELDKSEYVQIKFEEIRNYSADDSNSSEMVAETEPNTAIIYSDISDASQIEENQNAQAFKCDVCGKMFKSSVKFDKHKERHTYKYTCAICQARFKYNSLFVKHLLTHEPGIKKECNKKICSCKTTNKTDQRLQCDVCPAYFNSINSLSAHKKKHTAKDRVLSCSVCKKIFKKISHLRRHELSHENNRPFKCLECPKSFTTETMLREHGNKHHGIKPHCCPVCTKSFTHHSGLTNHIRTHTKDKLYLCPNCGKRFDSKTNLSQHIKRHIGLKMFACDLCPRIFVTKGELKSHGVTHTGEKSYSCDQCNAKFTKHSSMNKHKLSHLGVKPHQCDACPMKFTTKDHLTRHYRIHTGERPYRCIVCDRTFTQSNDLIKHKRSHFGNNLYNCSQCNQSFRLQAELRHHISEHFISSRLAALNVNTIDKSQALTDSNVPQINGMVHDGETMKVIEKEVQSEIYKANGNGIDCGVNLNRDIV